jgi:hypothetical protein
MPTAEELIVAIKSEGVGETQQDLEGVEQSMEDTADSAGDSADELEGFSERFQGAMAAAVAALAVGAAGLLSQVPVLGEAFAGLAAIVSALAFQMDGVLRPVLSPLTTAMFELSNMIFEADGALGTLIGAVSTIVSVLAIAIPAIAAVGSQLGIWASTGAGVVAILKAIGAAIAAVIGFLGGWVVALVAALALLTAFVAAYLTNWNGVRDKTDAIVSDIIDLVVGGFTDFIDRSLQKLDMWATIIGTLLSTAASMFTAWVDDLVSDARAWGTNLIESFIDGIKAALDRLKDWLGDLRDVGAKVGINVPSVGNLGGGGGGGGGGGRTGRPAPSGGGGRGVFLDGRSVSESTGRYREDPSRRRGL